MRFANLQYLWLAIITSCFLLLGFFYQLRKQVHLSNWVHQTLWRRVIPNYSEKKFRRRWYLLWVGVFFVLFSLLRPQWGEHEETIDSKGMDILFILDLSNSMLAEDVHPNRLGKAQLFIKKTLHHLQDDRVGIVGFAGSSFLAIPLTNDFDYVGEIVDSLNPNFILQQGTQISDAITVSMKAFERGGNDSRKTSRAMILISDGEDFGKNPEAVAEKVKNFESGFFVFGVGSTEGAPIPIRNENGVLQTYKKDRTAQPVLSRPNTALLSKIATSGDGKYFDLTNIDDAAYILGKQLSALHRGSTQEQRVVTKIDRYQIFLAVGIFFLILGYFISYHPLKYLMLVMVLLFGNPVTSHSQTLGGYWKNKRGIRHFEKKEYEESLKVFESARSSEPENPILEYNQATALHGAGKDEDAVFHYKESIKRSLSQGDYDTAAKSLYNEGLIHKKNKSYQESFKSLTNAIEMAKISKQPELEKKAREALLQSSQEQKKEQEQNQKNNKEEQKDQKTSSKDQQQNQDGEQAKNPENQSGKENEKKAPPRDQGQKREFRSGTLSKDVAEGIMNDLSDRERQLYQRKMKDKKPKESQNENDW